MSLDLGRVAYNAYRDRRGGVAYDGTAIPVWDALRPEIREAWGDAAAAVVGARAKPPTGAVDLDAARKTAREAQELSADSIATLEATDTEEAENASYDEAVTAAYEFAQIVKNSSTRIIPDLAALVLAMADEIERLRPVVDAVKKWVETDGATAEEELALTGVIEAFAEYNDSTGIGGAR